MKVGSGLDRGCLGLAAIPFLPSSFTERMGTIKTYKADASASTRLAVWQWTMDYAKTHPMGGGFDPAAAYRQRQADFEAQQARHREQQAAFDRANANFNAYLKS